MTRWRNWRTSTTILVPRMSPSSSGPTTSPILQRKNDATSPIFGMPVLDVENARTVLFVKRSLGSGYAGIDNELFFRENTMMLLGDAKKMCENIVKQFG